MIGVLENEFGDFGRRLDILETPDGAGAFGGTMHARGVELHHAVAIGKAAVSDGRVVGIELLDLHTFDHGVERIGALHQHVECFLNAAETVGARDGDGFGGPTGSRGQGLEWSHRMRNYGAGPAGRDAARGGAQEIPTRPGVGHG